MECETRAKTEEEKVGPECRCPKTRFPCFLGNAPFLKRCQYKRVTATLWGVQGGIKQQFLLLLIFQAVVLFSKHSAVIQTEFFLQREIVSKFSSDFSPFQHTQTWQPYPTLAQKKNNNKKSSRSRDVVFRHGFTPHSSVNFSLSGQKRR